MYLGFKDHVEIGLAEFTAIVGLFRVMGYNSIRIEQHNPDADCSMDEVHLVGVATSDEE